MKRLFLFATVLAFFGYQGHSVAQQVEKGDSLGLPGDNLNLYAVLDLFQKCETFEDFEKKLNQEDSKINNLDLNKDGKTDYIKVIDNKTGESHAVVLQVPVSEKENQDVAVIEIDKDKDGKVMVQIVGNEELYGKDYIVEPTENDPEAKKAAETSGNAPTRTEKTVSEDGKTTVINNYYTTNNYNSSNNNNSGQDVQIVYVPVNSWPMVHYMYSPSYVVYVSPWYWYSYPVWWTPWNPWYWHDYYWHHYHYYHNHYYYHRTNFYRAPIANSYYHPRRSVSTTVIQHRTAGDYKGTYKPVERQNGTAKPGTTNPAYRDKDKPATTKPAGTNKPATTTKPVQRRDTAPANKPVTPNTKPQTKPNSNFNKPVQKPRGGGSSTGRTNSGYSKPSGSTGRSTGSRPHTGGGRR